MTDTQDLKLSELKNIKYRTMEGKNTSLSPFFYYAFYMNLIIFSAGFLLSLLIDNNFLFIFKTPLLFILPLLLCFVSTIILYFLGSYKKTWSEHIDNLLSQYIPVNKDSYEYLKSVTIEKCYLDLEDVLIWVEVEEESILKLKNKKLLQSIPLNFLKK